MPLDLIDVEAEVQRIRRHLEHEQAPRDRIDGTAGVVARDGVADGSGVLSAVVRADLGEGPTRGPLPRTAGVGAVQEKRKRAANFKRFSAMGIC